LPETTAADAKWWPLKEIMDSEEPTTTPGLLDIVRTTSGTLVSKMITVGVALQCTGGQESQAVMLRGFSTLPPAKHADIFTMTSFLPTENLDMPTQTVHCIRVQC
jgi:hypothetical protein